MTYQPLFAEFVSGWEVINTSGTFSGGDIIEDANTGDEKFYSE